MNQAIAGLIACLLSSAVGVAAAGNAPFQCPKSYDDATLKPLRIHLVAEKGVYDAPRTDCLKWQFKDNERSENELHAWAKSKAATHSVLLFGREGLLKVSNEITRFDLQTLEAGLKEMQASNSPHMTFIEITDALHFVAKLRVRDAELSRKIAETCGKREATPTGNPQYWEYEGYRRSLYDQYAGIVQDYVRHKNGLSKGEGDLVVLLAPYKLLGPGQATDLTEHYNRPLSWLKSEWGSMPGATDEDGAEHPSRTTFPGFLKQVSDYVIVGGYQQNLAAITRLVYIHEIGHYVGLPHVFTTDLWKDDGHCKTLEGPDSAAPTDLETCECAFKGQAGNRTFKDADFVEAGIDDTSLVIWRRDRLTSWHAQCRRASREYRAYFDEEDTTARNIMVYQSKQDLYKQDPTTIDKTSAQQVEVAKCMLATFEQ